MPRYILPGRWPGLLLRGNINIDNRPPIRYRGGIATVRSITVGPATVDGRNAYVVIPTVVQRRVVTNAAATKWFRRTGQHLGMFNSIAHAEKYAIALHLYHARKYGSNP